MAEVDAGHQTPVQGAQLQHLLQVAQLTQLAHGLGAQGDVGKALVLTGGNDLGQGFFRNVQRLPALAPHQRPGVDDHPSRPHPVRHLTAGGDVADGLLEGVPVRVGQVDEVGGVEGQGYPHRPGVFPDFDGGLLSHVDTLAALVLVAVQAEVGNPPGGGKGGLVGLGKTLGIARGTEFRAHRKGLLSPSRRKGVSTA